MSSQEIEVLVVGAGQAGIAMSEHLGLHGVPHLVVERDRIAERWRSWRWDSLVANGPAWHDRFPGQEFNVEPDAFAAKEQVADYFVAYAEKIDAPIRTGVEVTSVRKNNGRPGFRVRNIGRNHRGTLRRGRDRTVPAAGHPAGRTRGRRTRIRFTPARTAIRNSCPTGAVLVVGAGSSGVQIADELQQSGRQVYLAVGPHDRPPRSYRGRDFCWWLGVLGKWDASAPPRGAEHVTIAVSGAHGGNTVDFRSLAASGITLLGMAGPYDDGIVHFAPDLRENIENGDANYLSMLDEADAYVARNGLDLPEEPQARILGPDPDCLTSPILELNLAAAGITSIIWATGFAYDFSWLQVDAFDENGKPNHQRGVSSEPGIYFLGLPWLSRRGSSFIWGVWHDAKYLADQIAVQRSYLAYQAAEPSDD